jgi:hypothetical protein
MLEKEAPSDTIRMEKSAKTVSSPEMVTQHYVKEI